METKDPSAVTIESTLDLGPGDFVISCGRSSVRYFVFEIHAAVDFAATPMIRELMAKAFHMASISS